MSFKVLCWTKNDVNGASNALRFETREEAEGYAVDLFSRWMALDRWEVAECDDPLNYRWNARRIGAELEEIKNATAT